MRQLFYGLLVGVSCSCAVMFSAEVKAASPAAHAHAHPEHGPHGGDLIELGKEEYHLELFHDEKAGVLAFYLLDSSAKKMLASPAKEIYVNIKAAGRGKQYKIAPSPQPNDPKDNFSCYATKDKELIETLDKHGIQASVMINIAGKQYVGKIEHHHHHDHGPAKN
jgi:hypothetical protein